MATTFAQDTTFDIEKIVQNAYIEPSTQGLPPTYLNTVLGESMSNLIAVDHTEGNTRYRKLYMAYVTDISFTSLDTVSGNIAIARFDENLNLEYIFRSPVLNTTNGKEANPSLIYGDKRLFLAYSTNRLLSVTDGAYIINGTGTTYDIVVAGLDIFTLNTSVQSEPVTGIRNELDILWIKQNATFNSNTDDEGYSAAADISNQNFAPYLAYDSLNKILYCAYNQYVSSTNFDVKILAVMRVLGLQTGSGPYTRNYDNTQVLTQPINLPQSTINTSAKDIYPAIAVDTSSNIHLIYRTEGTGTIGNSTKTITVTGNNYIYARITSPNFGDNRGVYENIAGQTNTWSLTDISLLPLTNISGNVYSPVDIKYSKGFLYIGASNYDSGAGSSFPVVIKINAHATSYAVDRAVGSSLPTATGTPRPSPVKILTDIKDPSNNDNVLLAYHTYNNNGTTNVNLARYNLSGSTFVFKDFTTAADTSGFNVAGKSTRNPSITFLNGYLYISAETNAATYYTDTEGNNIVNKYGGNPTITGNYDIAIAKINFFKPNRVKDISMTEGINNVLLEWGPNINATLGGNVNWWPPTNGSTFGYRISYRKTGEDAASFVDISDIAGVSGYNSFKIYTTNYTGPDSTNPNQRVLEKGYQYEFIVRALLNGAPGDFFCLSGMPVDGYVIASLSGPQSIFLGNNGARQPMTAASLIAEGNIPLGDCSFNTVTNNNINLTLSGGVAYNIAVRSYVLLTNTFANYSITDQSGIVIPRYAAPSSVTATSTNNSIKVTFTTVAGDNIDGYEIQYSKDGFTNSLSTIYPVKSMTPNTSVTTFLVYNAVDNTDAELPDTASYAVRIRAVGGRNLTTVNGINLLADSSGYRVYGLMSSATPQVAPNVITTLPTISGDRNIFDVSPTNANSSGYIHSHVIWPKWSTQGTVSNLSGCISINGFRFRLPVTTLDLSLSTTSIAAQTTILSVGLAPPRINPATAYDLKIFLCDLNGDPSGRIITRKLITAPVQPALVTVVPSAFNPNALSLSSGSLPTISTTWSYNDASGYPDLVGFKFYYRRLNDTFTSYTIPNSRTLTSAIIPNVPGGALYETYIRAYVNTRRIGEYLIITNAGVPNNPGEAASNKFNSNILTPPVNTIIRFLPSNTGATFVFDNAVHNLDYGSYFVTVSGVGVGNTTIITRTYDKVLNSISFSSLTASTTYAYIITVSGAYRGGYDFTTVNFQTATRAAQDISLVSVTASSQSVLLNLTRTVRSASGENLVVLYKVKNAAGALGSTQIKRFFATDSSQVRLTGLFPQRDLSDIQVNIEEFYPETNLFFYSNIFSYQGMVRPDFFAPRAPRLTAATPGVGDLSGTTVPYQATISWTPNVNYKE
jgi:hypothetical protein